MHPDDIRNRIIAGLPHARAAAMRAGFGHVAWDVVADAEAYVRGAPTFVPPETIAAILATYAPTVTPTRTESTRVESRVHSRTDPRR